MADTELDTFLGGAGEPAPEPQQEPAPPPEQQEPEEEAEGDPPEQEEAPEPPKPGERTVPLAALEAERAQRRDHKERAARLEGELAELRRQFDEAKRAAQQPPQQAQPPQQIDPVQDPAGYHAQVQQLMLNERLNISEMALRREIGEEKVEAVKAEFVQAMRSNPALQAQLYQQPDPYAWAAKQVEVMKLQREIGDDPAAYRAKLRAEIEAEMNAAQPAAPVAPVSPAARLAPSLANARSAAPRGSGAWAGPTPLEELFPAR
jgi:hypothetical protein